MCTVVCSKWIQTASGPPFWSIWRDSFAISIAAYHVPGTVLISFIKDTIFSIATGAMTVLSFWSSAVMHSDIPRFCEGQTCELNRDIMEIATPTSFRSLKVALICSSPWGNCYYLVSIYYLVGVEKWSQKFPLGITLNSISQNISVMIY